MAETIKLAGGDEVIQPFRLTDSDGAVLDTTDMEISGGVYWRGRLHIPLEDGVEITRVSDLPLEDNDPHGFVTLNEEQTILIPRGKVAKLRITVVLNGVTMSTYDFPIKRVE